MGIVRTSAQVEPVGSYAHAKNRMKGAVKCAVFFTDQRSEGRYRTTNDRRLSPHPEPEENDPRRCPFMPRSPAQHGSVA